MSADDPVTVLSEDESWNLLSSVSLGRLVTILGGTLKPLFVRVIAVEITGRRFKFGPEPDRESSLA
jgi:hypothetical protein